MPNLFLTYVQHDEEGPHRAPVVEIHCENLLEGLATLHEQLNAVGMPRIYRSTADATDEEIISGLRDARVDHPVTISC